MPVGSVHGVERRSGRAPGGAGVGAGARVPWRDDDFGEVVRNENSDCCALAALGGHLGVLR